jgi:alpha-mannosidase
VDSGSEPAILAVNPDLSPRPARVVLDTAALGAQPVDSGFVLTASDPVPGCGAVVVTESREPSGLSASNDGLENDFVRVTIAADGTLAEVFDKRAGRDALAGRANALWAYVDKPRAWDAWDIDVSYTDAAEEVVASASPVAVESGPHRAAVRIERRWRNSRIVQDVRLWANSPRIDFHTVVDWHDRRYLLKARFPLSVRATHATFETAFGVVQRPTYRNTSWDTAQFEVPGHRFADLSEPGYGVAVLNDGRYGHHALRNELGLTLLRSPVWPDPRADEGRHEFTYALCPHAGGWLEGGVLAEAEDLNRPLLARALTAASPSRWSAVDVDGMTLGLGALKVCEDGGALVLRAYEPHGARGRVTLDLPDGWAATAGLDLLERDTGAPNLAFTPFAVRSWLLERTGR